MDNTIDIELAINAVPILGTGPEPANIKSYSDSLTNFDAENALLKGLFYRVKSRLWAEVVVKGGRRAPAGSQTGNPRDGVVELP